MAVACACMCENCNHSVHFGIGSLRSEAGEACHAPVYCSVCENLCSADYFSTPLACQKCGSSDVLAMDSLEVWKGDGTINHHAWWGAALPSTHKSPRSRTVGPEHLNTRLRRWRYRCFGSWKEIHYIDVHDRKRYKITDGHYLCPKCKSFSMRFPAALQCMMLFH